MNQTLITFDSMLTTAGGWKLDETLKYGRGISKRLIFTPFCVIDCAVLSSYLINLPFTYNTFFSFTFYFYDSTQLFIFISFYLFIFAFFSLFSLWVVFQFYFVTRIFQ